MGMTIIDQFRETVRKWPNHIALASEDEGVLTYQELDEQSNYVASRLLMHNDCPTVGVFLYRSFKQIVTMLAILKAGKAYVPIDPGYPEGRINWMLNNSCVNLIVCEEMTHLLLESTKSKLFILNNEIPCLPVAVNYCAEDDVACVLYTSGSTGLPNGVMMTHSAIMNTLTWAISFYKLSENDVALQVPSCSFTSSVQDIFSSLLSGGALVLLNDKRMLNNHYFKELNSIVKSTDKLQINYYFDTDDFALYKTGNTLRIRQTDTGMKMQFKFNKYCDGVVNICEEHEKQMFGFTPVITSHELPDPIAAENVYKYVGCLVTLRKDYHIGDSMVSLDKNYYWGKEDYEIECEFVSFDAAKEFIRFMRIEDNKGHVQTKYSRFCQEYFERGKIL